MRGNRSGAYAMWNLVLNHLNKDMKRYDKHPDSTFIPPGAVRHEQDILREVILPAMLSKGQIKVINLDRCKYASGLWYIQKAVYLKMCGSKFPAVLNNNFLVGNDKKILRAKDRKHWFLNGDKCSNWADTLHGVIESFTA